MGGCNCTSGRGPLSASAACHFSSTSWKLVHRGYGVECVVQCSMQCVIEVCNVVQYSALHCSWCVMRSAISYSLVKSAQCNPACQKSADDAVKWQFVAVCVTTMAANAVQATKCNSHCGHCGQKYR